ncbi:hybrid sensor histidine kinase/response regulator transcription factor [Desertivirga arenae]|uniref:hybrid sensor histidine kinase/response regulator transcription factor n=1 Tax=Desertivirga arenae TaxID=2810309 RepID=UPI001A977D2C|nr:hybrid sensor histidine kinase/response regulator transcription factor [Pedobacter sp. SYSU D00823]
MNFMNLGSREGLSSNIVTSILKDRFGYLWFGTDDGLNKFDGKQFTVYRHNVKDSNSIASNDIVDLYEDGKGNLWIATSSGVIMYNRRMDSFINYNKLIRNPILSIATGPDGSLWMGTYGALILFNPVTSKFTYFYSNDPAARAAVSTTIQRVFTDKSGSMWLGTSNGLYLYLEKSNSFKKYVHSDKDSSSLANNAVKSVIQDRKGNIWVGTDSGLSMLLPDGSGFTNYKHTPSEHSLSSNIIYSLAAEPNGRIWIGTEEGLNILDPSSKVVRRIRRNHRNPYSLIGKAVNSILIDREGISWVGTYRGGINKYDKNLPTFNLRQSNPSDPLGLSAPVVTSFAEVNRSEIYVGTDGGGINHFNRNTGLFKNIPLSNSGKGKAVLAMEGVGAEIWVGTYLDGLFVYDTKTGEIRRISAGLGSRSISGPSVFCIKKDSRNNIWLGTNGQGVTFYDSSKKSFRHFSQSERGGDIIMANGYIRAIEEDHEGNLWIGSRGGGIAVYNPISNKSLILNSANSKLPKDNVNAICVSSNGTVWVGMSEGGLAYYDLRKKQFIPYSEKDGLANEVIYRILEDNYGKIWVSTNKGLSSFDPGLKKFRNFSYHNGLQRSPFVLGSGMKVSDGTLFFGGVDGFNYVNPGALHFNRNNPRIVLTDLKISNKSVLPSPDAEINEHISISKRIKLDYKQNFSLSFAALNFTSPQENRYMYKLEKFDREWNNVGALNTAVYTNLDPGEYTFYVKAVSANGNWVSPVTTIRVSVRPPFWLTYPAYFFYFLIIGLVLWLIRRRGIQKLEGKFAIEQERREAERVHEFDQLKIKFLTNLSHEFRTPISLIMGPVEQLLQLETSTNKHGQLSMIRRNARRLLNLVNQLLDFRNMEDRELRLNVIEGDFIAFARDVAESFRDYSERRQINFEFNSQVRSYFTNFDHEKVERIFFNLLSNAFKFTLKGGLITFRIEDSDNGLKVQVADTGIGIEEKAHDKIFESFFQSNSGSAILNQGSGIGLSITREFVNMHGGSIEVHSIVGKGSVFSIHFPFNRIESPGSLDEDEPELMHEGNPQDHLLGAIADSQLPVVLLVEDSDDFRFYLKDNLKRAYRIVEASNGKEGWQKTLSSHPQLVVSDISMPHASGIDLCRKIKADKRTSHIPVLLLTALTGEEDQLLGLETGANDYMTKPFNLDILNVKIRNLLALNERLKKTYTKQIKMTSPEVIIESENEKFLNKVILYITSNINNPQLSVEDLSRNMGMSRGSLYSKILELTGETPIEFIRSIKLDRAAVLLEKSDMNIAQISYSVGFSAPNYFARAFKIRFNMLPSEYIISKRGSN